MRRARTAAWAAAQAAVVLGILYVALGGSQRDFHVPLQYSEDALEYLMQTHGTIQTGWWWTQPSLGAPGVFEQVTYPSNTSVDQAIVRVVGWLAPEPGLCLNLTWMLLVAVSSLVATACLRLAGVSWPVAAVGGVLFALTPYALARNIQHFSLAIYLVPIPSVAALLVAADRWPERRMARVALAVGTALVGFNYIYYAFFGVVVLLVASLAALIRDPRGPTARRALGLTVILVVATAVNLAPSLRAWSAHDKPLVIPDKTAAESEIYGLKIRQLLSPVPDHPFAPFERWTTLERRAGFPAETENTTSRLGLIASIGFLLLIAAIVAPASGRWTGDSALVVAAASLAITLVLLGTVGGFGSLFNLLVSPEVRAYNRVCPFLAFYAWVSIGLLVDRLLAIRFLTRSAAAQLAVIAGIGGLGIWDQVGALEPLNRAYAANRTEWANVGAFVAALEPKLPPNAMVFQLPLTVYLNDLGEGRMRTYDEIKPSLVSRSIHWSYPALDNAVVRWQRAVARLPPHAMAAALRDAGFRAIAIDRDGYGDGGASIVAALTPASGTSPVLAEAPGYVALDLERVDASADGIARLPRFDGTFGPMSDGLPSCGAPATALIDHIGPVKAPPSGPITVERDSTYAVRGWAIDDVRHALAGDVDVVVDGQPRAAYYGVNRPDVAARAGVPAYRDSGVLTRLPAALLPPGPHRLALRVVSADRACVSETTTLTVIVPAVF
jgi:phosphoglycerol transferase